MGGRGSTAGTISRARWAKINAGINAALAAAGFGPNGQQPQNVANQAPTTQNTPVVPDAVSKLAKMTDDELTALFNQSQGVDMPNHLSDVNDRTQKFVYMAGINEKPEVLDKKAFDKYRKDNNIPDSQVMARSVNGLGYVVNGTTINLTSSQITSMMKDSELTYVGGKHGGMVHGAGTYFDMNGGVPTGYAGGATAIAVLSKKANVISDGALANKVSAFAKTHPKFAKAVGPYRNSTKSIYALAMGYNVIQHGSYHNVIDRAALVMRREDY